MSRTLRFEPSVDGTIEKLRGLRPQQEPSPLKFGEVYWVVRDGWKGCGGFFTNESRDHHPGLVLKPVFSYRPAMMTPGTSKHTDGNRVDVFVPRKPVITTDDKLTHFILAYRRPVQPRHIENNHGPCGGLDDYDCAKLEIKLRDLRTMELGLDGEGEE